MDCALQRHSGIENSVSNGTCFRYRGLVKPPAQRHSITQSTWLYSTISPGCAIMRMTLPSHGALISFMIFIASMMQRVSPSFTVLADEHERRLLRRREKNKTCRPAGSSPACRPEAAPPPVRAPAVSAAGCGRRRRCGRGRRRCRRRRDDRRGRRRLDLDLCVVQLELDLAQLLCSRSASISSMAMSFSSLISIGLLLTLSSDTGCRRCGRRSRARWRWRR